MKRKNKVYLILMYISFVLYIYTPIIDNSRISVWNNYISQIFVYWRTGLSLQNIIILTPCISVMGMLTYQHICQKRIFLQEVWCGIAVFLEWFIADGVGLLPFECSFLITGIILFNSITIIRLCVIAHQFPQVVHPIRNVVKHHLKRAIIIIILFIAIVIAGNKAYHTYLKYDTKHLRFELEGGNGNARYSVKINENGVIKQTHSYEHDLFWDYKYGWTYKGIKPGKTDINIIYIENSEGYEATYHVTVDKNMNISCIKEELRRIEEDEY